MPELDCVVSPNSSSFFRILMPGFANRLRLPTKFVKNVLEKERSKTRTASLVNPNGESWHVSVCKDVEHDFYIGGLGWAELVHAHNIGFGYLMLFRYDGNMVFNFRAFDLSTCEIGYPSIAQWVAKKLNQKAPVFVDHKDEEEEEKCHINPTSNVGIAEEKGLLKSNATVRFEAELTNYNIAKGHVNIPIRFKESSGLWEQEELRLKDPRGQLWTVRLQRKGLRRGRKTQSCLMSGGIVNFVRANRLEEGDRCIFELVARGRGKENVMQVKVVRKHQASKS